MTPKTITMLVLRLFAVFVLFKMAFSIGTITFSLLNADYHSLDLIEYQLLHVSIYTISIMLLYSYSEKIANKITKPIPTENFNANCTFVELLTVLIISLSIYTIIDAIPLVVNQLYAVLSSLGSEFGESVQTKQRFNMFFFGLLGAFLKVIVPIVLIIKAKSIAIYLHKKQNNQACPPRKLNR